ncbi:MAG: ankyrin repeat domain-containing protein [Clostridia bacterium]|nr:ankyrin repeat domain-containing protein [Clostridia bacterium]
MKKAIALILVLVLACLSMVSCSTREERKYAKALNNAIIANDYELVKSIIAECPSALNTYPTLAPSWWQGEILMTRIYYPLAEACKAGNLEMVKLLVESGADVNSYIPDDREYTPIHVALDYCEDDWYEIVMYLISKGASIDYVDDYGQGAIFIDMTWNTPVLAKEDAEKIYSLFCYAFDNCDKSNVDWQRVFCYAIMFDHYEIVKVLLKDGYADVNASVSNEKITPLMFAVRSSDVSIVKYLLDNGADVNAVDSDGKTVSDYLAKRNNEEINALFE